MKTLKLLLPLLFLFATNSCSIDDETYVNTTYYGAWHLVEVSGTIAGSTHEFEYGTIVWNFAPNLITIVNNNNNEDLIDKFETGSYPFIVDDVIDEQYGCLQRISFSADDINCFQYNKDTMYITQNAADGIVLKLIR